MISLIDIQTSIRTVKSSNKQIKSLFSWKNTNQIDIKLQNETIGIELYKPRLKIEI